MPYHLTTQQSFALVPILQLIRYSILSYSNTFSDSKVPSRLTFSTGEALQRTHESLVTTYERKPSQHHYNNNIC